MTTNNFWQRKIREGAVLSPVDRIGEVLFGLIMVLSFTGTVSVASDGRQEIRQLLWAAIGCNLAWGLVDAIMYIMNVLVERGHARTVVNTIKQAANAGSRREILKGEITPVVAEFLRDAEADHITDQIRQLPELKKQMLFSVRDLISGMQIFLLVFLCTLPVALPFAIFDNVSVALRASNGVALLLLFVGGFLLARYAGFRPLLTAIAYTIIGLLLVSVTMALGG